MGATARIEMSITRTVSANHTVTYLIPREKTEEWPPSVSGPQAKVQQHPERLVDSEHTPKNQEWHTITDDKIELTVSTVC